MYNFILYSYIFLRRDLFINLKWKWGIETPYANYLEGKCHKSLFIYFKIKLKKNEWKLRKMFVDQCLSITLTVSFFKSFGIWDAVVIMSMKFNFHVWYAHFSKCNTSYTVLINAKYYLCRYNLLMFCFCYMERLNKF